MSPTKFISLDELDVGSLKGITQDSRAVVSGGLFAALRGEKGDGADYIPQAIEKGARYILTDSALPNIEYDDCITVVQSANPRRDLAILASRYYGDQPSVIVAVGGTNGKSSTVNFIRSLWEQQGYKAVSIGTLGVCGKVDTRISGASMTTPDSVSLHAALKNLHDEGVTHCAIEASSHGLHQHRLDGVKIQVSGFTSFSRDHLDYHKDEKSYFEAKTRQFADLMPRGSYAVLNADIPEFQSLKKIASENGHHVFSYGKDGEEFKIIDVAASQASQRVTLKIMGDVVTFDLPLAGYFQVMNAVCAFACVYASSDKTKQTLERLLHGLSKLDPVEGRLQRIGDNPEKVVYVDYAHTPDALETVLKALRPHVSQKLVCVFGCGGDRDEGKRPVMGEIAARLCDEVIVTDDNPRSEDAGRIRQQILNGARPASKSVQEIENRAEAILLAVMQIGSGDVLLVAGKGHEQGQIFNGYTMPFSDAQEVLKSLSKFQ